jgi:putative tricarboxylic transport membrane protein
MRVADVTAGVVVAVIGAGALEMALHMAFLGQGGVPGPGFFPVLLSTALIVLGLVLGAMSLRPAQVEVRAVGAVPDGAGSGEDTDDGPGPSRLRPAVVLVLFVACVPLLTVVGFVITGALLMAVLLFAVERRRGWIPLLAAIVVPVALYELFTELLSIQLPVGMFGTGVLGL